MVQDHEPLPVPASLIYPGQGRLPMKTRAFIDFAAAVLRERMQGLAPSPPRVSSAAMPAPQRPGAGTKRR